MSDPHSLLYPGQSSIAHQRDEVMLIATPGIPPEDSEAETMVD